ncbi:MAG: tRNA (guanosine(46)-N7)-methyltransferase TrmB [Clostridia bacterium]|nr:tRNA (guanosine(46)-N7)-methyltransferase TrmB [Clostridia bacterium]
MHRKPHLDERFSKCLDICTPADLSDRNMKTAVLKKEYLDLYGIFGRENERRLEIGCGKGRFVIESAVAEPDVDFVAVEKSTNVIISALEETKRLGLKNIHYINTAAEVLPKYIRPDTFERIYLNFSNPLPKSGEARQRLTHPGFLRMYREFLKDGGEVWQKTDSAFLYEFSLESFRQCAFDITFAADIMKEQFEGNIVTEHEEMFMERGLPIYRIVAVCKKDAK